MLPDGLCPFSPQVCLFGELTFSSYKLRAGFFSGRNVKLLVTLPNKQTDKSTSVDAPCGAQKLENVCSYAEAVRRKQHLKQLSTHHL